MNLTHFVGIGRLCHLVCWVSLGWLMIWQKVFNHNQLGDSLGMSEDSLVSDCHLGMQRSILSTLRYSVTWHELHQVDGRPHKQQNGEGWGTLIWTFLLAVVVLGILDWEVKHLFAIRNQCIFNILNFDYQFLKIMNLINRIYLNKLKQIYLEKKDNDFHFAIFKLKWICKNNGC